MQEDFHMKKPTFRATNMGTSRSLNRAAEDPSKRRTVINNVLVRHTKLAKMCTAGNPAACRQTQKLFNNETHPKPSTAQVQKEQVIPLHRDAFNLKPARYKPTMSD